MNDVLFYSIMWVLKSFSSRWLAGGIAEDVVEILQRLIHPPPQLRARRLLIIIIPRLYQQILILLPNTQILIPIKRKHMPLIIVIIQDDLPLRPRRGCLSLHLVSAWLILINGLFVLSIGLVDFLDRRPSGVSWYDLRVGSGFLLKGFDNVFRIHRHQ